jgi:hypothetical protein
VHGTRPEHLDEVAMAYICIKCRQEGAEEYNGCCESCQKLSAFIKDGLGKLEKLKRNHAAYQEWCRKNGREP